MGFEVIPAIDVTEGRLGRLTPAGPVAVPAFGGDPVTAAEAYMRAGARRLHVVDMDLAFTGAALNVETVMAVRRVALFHGVRVQASGGVVTEDDVAHLLDVGVDRVVLGSGALATPTLVADLVERYEERIVVGIEVEGDRVRARGPASVDLALDDTLAWLDPTAASRFIVTSLRRVGGLAGPDLDAVRRVGVLERPVLAAGGVASVEDLLSVRAAGAEGAVVGRAALEAAFDLSAAVDLLAG